MTLLPFRSAASTAVLAALLAMPAAAQAPAPGSRVRLTVPCAGADPAEPGPRCEAWGRLVALEADALVLAQDTATTRHSLGTILRLEEHVGRRSRWLPGAALGFAAGAVVTHLALRGGGSTAPCNRGANQDAMSAGECLGLAALGGVAGAGLGALVGSRIRRDRWRAVSLP
jgi:hypothetical protein